MSINQALVRREPTAVADLVATQSIHKPAAPVPELTEDLVNQLLAGRGLRGWLRAAKLLAFWDCYLSISFSIPTNAR
jgi:hypothetical protein